MSRTYNNTLAVSGNLRRLLEAWLGRSLSYDEQQHGFNLRWMEGKNARLYLARNGPWVDVVEVLPPTWGDPELEIEHLVRWKSHRRETAWQDHSSLESSEASSSSPSGSDSSMIAGTDPTAGTTVPRDQD